jgi:hypothetical protein
MNESNDPGFVLAESVAKNTFDDDIYAHLGALVAVEFSREHSAAQAGRFELNASKYEALEQAAFEEAPRMEARPPQAVDWAAVDQSVSTFEAKLAQSLRGVAHANEGDTTVFVEFSSKCYENFLTYREMYPPRDDRSGDINPWVRTMRLMRYGRLLVIGDAGGLNRARGRKGQRSDRDSSHPTLTALVKGASARPASMDVDDRFTLQAKLLSFLKANARGHANRIPLKQIRAHLRTIDVGMTEQTIQVKLTVPLKRAGVVGSNAKGFFFIDSPEDLIQSYCFHRTKVLSSNGIMRRYQTRARDMDPDLNLEERCSTSGPVLNRRFP